MIATVKVLRGKNELRFIVNRGKMAVSIFSIKPNDEDAVIGHITAKLSSLGYLVKVEGNIRSK